MATDSTLIGNWNYPTSIRFGAGRITELADACTQLGMSNPLLVTDAGLASLPMTSDALTSLNNTGLNGALFSNVKPNPTGDNINAGVKAYTAGNHDGVIAFGGGSGLDAGKAIALMAGQTRPIWDFEDAGDNWQRVDPNGIAPIVAVPTTAGTGSEVGRASVIMDEAAQLKKIIFHPKMLPQIVIVDPALTTGLPATLTAATGMDALSHNLEAYCSPGYHPMADGIALEAIRMIKEHLPTAYREPHNIKARSQMLAASTMGATAFQKGLGGMHALAHPLGALYDAHHGMLNAILMPYVLSYNRPAIEERIVRLARYLDLDTYNFDSFLKWIVELRTELKIPNNLKDIGINDDKLDRVAAMAVEDPSAGGNPVLLTTEEYKGILEKAVTGKY
ncbi:iron-containing alcohol dehydrogenase [Pseudomonadota bacterium]